MYKLDNAFTADPFTVTIVGCGGTGAFVAEGLSRLLPLYCQLVLIDPDRVEERNLSRQNFFRSELGRFKSEALAERLSRLYLQPVAYAVTPVALTHICYPGILIGCVDNGQARKDIADRLSGQPSLRLRGWYGFSNNAPREWQHPPDPTTCLWWVDAGNGENYGQILIGNAPDKDLYQAFNEEKETCRALPFPTIQRPELLAQVPPVMNCADNAEQEPTINRVTGALVVEVVRRIIEGTCSWMQLWLDLEAGTLTPVLATPENVAGITKQPIKRLLERRKEAQGVKFPE